ncbi:Permeases of the major facilitator superfamily [Parasaccharibacter apium]|uniref:Permeases of the major facilitator superfamily n=1 Tax=Parasaccharibacter apium TaxID=1510841 RepID=A0A7U7G7C2_9PROT|nr:MFS transporter [Parasaccharibacter apium]CDG34365.1 Permeases of the major facilitator superfamily [Parasaccharibacter apium]
MPVSASSSSPGGRPGFSALLPYWQVTLAAFSGWFLDAFDQTTLMFTLPDIARDFGCTLAALGSVFLAQALGRAVGNTGWGWLSDRFGRKPAFTLGILFFALFAALTGTTHSITTLVITQFLFGIGFGGEWTASATLLMESVPGPLRPLASATMMAGYEIGYMAAAGAQALILPHHGWRVMFFIGLLPALLIFFIRFRVKESPLWLAAQEEKKRQHDQAPAEPAASFWQTARQFWNGAAFQAIAFMCFLEFQKAALYTFYPAILRDNHHLSPQLIFWPVALYCLGSLAGKILCGALATRFGEGLVMRVALGAVMLLIIPFLTAGPWAILLASAFFIGAAASGIYALVPHYLSQRFPDAGRSAGMGTSYAVGSLGQGVAGRLVPSLAPLLAGGLPASAILCVLSGSFISLGITVFRPKDVQDF